jgi:ribosome-associated protein
MSAITIHTETIRLTQFLKLVDAVQDGVEAKIRIQAGLVMVNNAVETRRGRKLKPGDQVAYAGEVYEVCGPAG